MVKQVNKLVPGTLKFGTRKFMLVAALLSAGAAQAERPRVYAITGARIVTAPGKVIDNGTLVIRDDVIEAVGSKVTVPPDAEVIAASAITILLVISHRANIRRLLGGAERRLGRRDS